MSSGFQKSCKSPLVPLLVESLLIESNHRSRSHEPLWNPTFDGSDSYGDKINSKMPNQSNVVHMSRYHDLILTRSTDQAIMQSCSIKHQMSKPELGRGQWSTCPLKKAGGATWRSTAPSVHHVVHSDSIANKGALYVFLSLKLCIGFFSLQMLRGQALVKVTRMQSNPRLGSHAGLPGREFAMHRDWALTSSLVAQSEHCAVPISVWNGNDQRAVASTPIICSGKVSGIPQHLEGGYRTSLIII